MNYLLMLTTLLLVSCGKEQIKVIGTNGADGTSCYSEYVTGGVDIICGDDIKQVSNGQDGSFDGHIELVEVCPEVSGSYKEALLLIDGEYMAFLSNGNHMRQRLVILEENQVYVTTDGRDVNFKVEAGNITCL